MLERCSLEPVSGPGRRESPSRSAPDQMLAHADRPELVFAEPSPHMLDLQAAGREAKLHGVDAARDEERVDAEPCGAGDVGTHGVADGEDAVQGDSFTAAQLRAHRQGGLVDRPVRLAGIIGAPADLLVCHGEGTGAPNEAIAALDDEVRIGADHPQVALAHALQAAAIILNRLGLVVAKTRADDVIGGLYVAEGYIEPVEDGAIA